MAIDLQAENTTQTSLVWTNKSSFDEQYDFKIFLKAIRDPEVQQTELSLKTLLKNKLNVNVDIKLHEIIRAQGEVLTRDVYLTALKQSINEIEAMPEVSNNELKDITFMVDNFGQIYEYSKDTVVIPIPIKKGFWYGVLTKEGIKHPEYKKMQKIAFQIAIDNTVKQIINLDDQEKKLIALFASNVCKWGSDTTEEKLRSLGIDKDSTVKISSNEYAVDIDIHGKNLMIDYFFLKSGRRNDLHVRKSVTDNSDVSEKILDLYYTDDCMLKKGKVSTWEKGHKIQDIYLDSMGKSERYLVYNPKVIPLEELYCGTDNMPEIKKHIMDNMRIIITLLDTGINYNDPEVAKHLAKIPKDLPLYLSKTKSETKDKIEKLRIRKKILEAQIAKLSTMDKLKRWLYYSEEEELKDTNKLLIGAEKLLAELEKKITSQLLFVGYDFDQKDDQPSDYENCHLDDDCYYHTEHGTDIAKSMLKSSQEVSILNLKRPTDGSGEEYLNAIDYAVTFGSPIVNMSFGTDQKKGEYIHQAMKKYPKTLFVSAAGNNSADSSSDLEFASIYPAKYREDNHLVVANLDKNGKLDDYSFYSTKYVEIATSAASTSYSAAEVSRVAGRVQKICPQFTGVQLKAHLIETSDKNEELKKFVKEGAVLNETKAVKVAEKKCLLDQYK